MSAAGDARGVYRRIAPFYDFLDGSFERKRYAPVRGELFAGLTGRILDAGVGTGRNIPYYPAGAQMVGIDLSQAMLAQARARRDALGSDVPLAAMDVLRTGFADSSFDAVVASFVFCVLKPDRQRPALEELGRIVRPGGEIRLLDYTWSKRPWRRFVMGLWAPWVRWAYGAGFDREPHRHVEPAGLELAESRFLIDDVVRFVVARRPPAPSPSANSAG
ncbi:MAG: class I SAM-dependent methyltransferase [Rhodospirillaceae bacterium]|nr:class I SAM-dependent methyltransferase [Rhodospirillaceae bacterium]